MWLCRSGHIFQQARLSMLQTLAFLAAPRARTTGMSVTKAIIILPTPYVGVVVEHWLRKYIVRVFALTHMGGRIFRSSPMKEEDLKVPLANENGLCDGQEVTKTL